MPIDRKTMHMLRGPGKTPAQEELGTRGKTPLSQVGGSLIGSYRDHTVTDPGITTGTAKGSVGTEKNFQKVLGDPQCRVDTMSATLIVCYRECKAAYFQMSGTLALGAGSAD